VDDELELTRFEQELIHRLRALPFAARQHVSRYIIKLLSEQEIIPREDPDPSRPGEKTPPKWTMTREEIREALRERDDRGDG
jgi:hypothetical protein